MSGPTADESLDHERWWHEDDVVHQAEGVLSVQHGVPMGEAVATLRAYSLDVGTQRRTVALQVTSHAIFIPRQEREPGYGSS